METEMKKRWIINNIRWEKQWILKKQIILKKFIKTNIFSSIYFFGTSTCSAKCVTGKFSSKIDDVYIRDISFIFQICIAPKLYPTKTDCIWGQNVSELTAASSLLTNSLFCPFGSLSMKWGTSASMLAGKDRKNSLITMNSTLYDSFGYNEL